MRDEVSLEIRATLAHNLFVPEKMKNIGVVIPNKNMGSSVVALLNSIKKQELLSVLHEIMIVNDSCTDSSRALIEQWTHENQAKLMVKIIESENPLGRFHARYLGASKCTASHVLFLDARVSLPEGFAKKLLQIFEVSDTLMPLVQIRIEKSIFNLYWQRSHEAVFRKSYAESTGGHWINEANYHQHMLGTTAMACQRAGFLEACGFFLDKNLINDDTTLLFHIAKITPFYRHQDFFVWWEPRQSYQTFLSHIFFARGHSLADYHVFTRWSWLTLGLFLAWVLIFLNLLLCIFVPIWGALLALTGLVALASSTALFAKNRQEFILLWKLHLATILCYTIGSGLGILRVGYSKLMK